MKDLEKTTKNKLVDNKKYLKCNATRNKKNKNVNFYVFPGVKFLTCRARRVTPFATTRTIQPRTSEKDNFLGYCKLNKSSMKFKGFLFALSSSLKCLDGRGGRLSEVGSFEVCT